MANDGVIARPYAQAVFEIARADGQLAAWTAFLDMAAGIATHDDVRRALAQPGADLGELAGAIAGICRDHAGESQPLQSGVAGNFLRLLAENRRLGLLPHIAARYQVLRDEAENVLDVTLASAVAVSEAQQGSIVASLQKRFGRQIRLKVTLDETLIGGARLQVGDLVIDGSVRTGLDKLATALRA